VSLYSHTGVARIVSGMQFFPHVLNTQPKTAKLTTSTLHVPRPAKISSQIWLFAPPAGGCTTYTYKLRPPPNFYLPCGARAPLVTRVYCLVKCSTRTCVMTYVGFVT